MDRIRRLDGMNEGENSKINIDDYLAGTDDEDCHKKRGGLLIPQTLPNHSVT